MRNRIVYLYVISKTKNMWETAWEMVGRESWEIYYCLTEGYSIHIGKVYRLRCLRAKVIIIQVQKFCG